ncbi:MAG: hypothetical protein ACM3S4_13670 [Burkholderiales bacterium]
MKKAFIFLAVAALLVLPAGTPHAELKGTAVEIPVIIAPSLSSTLSA